MLQLTLLVVQHPKPFSPGLANKQVFDLQLVQIGFRSMECLYDHDNVIVGLLNNTVLVYFGKIYRLKFKMK